MSRLATPTTEQRQRQAAWLQEHEALMRERLLGCALVITSPFIRLAVSVVLHLKPLPVPFVIVPDRVSGVRWVTGRLDEAGFHEQAERIRHHFGLISRRSVC
jgi:hypothetical protein